MSVARANTANQLGQKFAQVIFLLAVANLSQPLAFKARRILHVACASICERPFRFKRLHLSDLESCKRPCLYQGRDEEDGPAWHWLASRTLTPRNDAFVVAILAMQWVDHRVGSAGSHVHA